MQTSGDDKWMVAVVNNVFDDDKYSDNNNNNFDESRCLMNRSSSSTRSNHKLMTLNDPSSQERREYISAVTKDSKRSSIVEIQSLAADFSSMFVGRHVVKDGNLYVLNKVDPLFFVLALHQQQVADELLSPSTTKRQQWQPLDQTLGTLPEPIRNTVSETQMSHLFETLSNDQTDNVTYFKFSVPKSLVWLQKKQECVYQCLLQQGHEKKKQEKKNYAQAKSTRGGSVSATFNMPANDPMETASSKDEDNDNDNENDEIVLSDTKQFQMESIQIVCSYLSENWTKHFVASLNLTMDDVFGEKRKSKTLTTPGGRYHAQVVVEDDSSPNKSSNKKVEPSRTTGNKRLAKVNTKGMASMSSFFGAPKSKKNKTSQ